MRALETLPVEEMAGRVEKARAAMLEIVPEPVNMLFFSRTAIYYFTGHWGAGVCFIPVQGKPILFCRRGIERARMESPFPHILPFRSYSDILPALVDFGYTALKTIGVEKKGLDWAMADRLQKSFSGVQCVSCDEVFSQVRAVKSDWELRKMALAGQRHDHAIRRVLPERIRPGMSEWDIAMKTWQVFFEHGHQGMMRMQAAGEEIFLGHVAAGDSGNYPSVFNGPLGLRGTHPACVHMGYRGKVWQENEPLILDCGFVLEGYHSDKTQTYWSKNNSVPPQVQAAQQVCVEIEHELAALLRVGSVPEDLFVKAWDMAKAAGQEEGFMGLGGNKVAFIGHGIGLSVDELPVIAKKFRQPLQKNMTFALEPKIGIAGVGMVGVENTFVVTETGGRRLSGSSDAIILVE